jgi:hypothetical protein
MTFKSYVQLRRIERKTLKECRSVVVVVISRLFFFRFLRKDTSALVCDDVNSRRKSIVKKICRVMWNEEREKCWCLYFKLFTLFLFIYKFKSFRDVLNHERFKNTHHTPQWMLDTYLLLLWSFDAGRLIIHQNLKIATHLRCSWQPSSSSIVFCPDVAILDAMDYDVKTECFCQRKCD